MGQGEMQVGIRFITVYFTGLEDAVGGSHLRVVSQRGKGPQHIGEALPCHALHPVLLYQLYL